MKYALVEHGKIIKVQGHMVDVPPEHLPKYEQVDDEVEAGWRWQETEVEGVFAYLPYIKPARVPKPEVISIIPVIHFKQLFTQPERKLWKQNKNDEVLEDFEELITDVRMMEIDLTFSQNIAVIDHMVTLLIITLERAVEIKAGQFPTIG